MENDIEKRVVPNLTIFATVAPIVWFIFGAFKLITGQFHADNLLNAFITITIYFTVGTAASALSAFIPAILYILLGIIIVFIVRKNIPLISRLAADLLTLLTFIFIIIVAIWTIYIGNWTIGVINGLL